MLYRMFLIDQPLICDSHLLTVSLLGFSFCCETCALLPNWPITCAFPEKKNRVNAQQQQPPVTPTTGNSAVDRAIIGKEPEVVKPPVPPKSTDIGEEKMPWRQPPKPKTELGVTDRTALALSEYCWLAVRGGALFCFYLQKTLRLYRRT